MGRPAVPIVVQGGGSSAAGILLLLVAIVGLLALFSGNLDRFIEKVAGPAGGAEGLYTRGVRGPMRDTIEGGQYGEPVPTSSAGRPGSAGQRPL